MAVRRKPKVKDTPDISKQTMVKKVNVIAQIPVRNTYPTIYGTYKGIHMSPINILKCLMHKAKVTEILPDGSELPLNMHNYNTINNPEDKEVQKAVLEYRNHAVNLDRPIDTRDLNMEMLENYTAPIPRGHYLYNIKTENHSDNVTTQLQSTCNDIARDDIVMEEEGNPLKLALPTIDTETGEVVPANELTDAEQCLYDETELMLRCQLSVGEIVSAEETDRLRIRAGNKKKYRNKWKG